MSALTELECESYLCYKCKRSVSLHSGGIMLNASQFGEEQTPVCEPCAGPHCNVTPIVRARKRIATFHVKCPLATRGCDWNSTIAEVETHLGLCEEFVVSCSNKCEQFMKRSELGDHSQECELRFVHCEYCQMEIIQRHIELHYETCGQYPLPCPINCTYNLKRDEIEFHLEKECPNTLVECNYRRFGCMYKGKRCELSKHKDSSEMMHLEKVMVYGAEKVEQVENRLQARLDEHELAIMTLKQENIKIKELLKLSSVEQARTDYLLSELTRRRSQSASSQKLPPFFTEKRTK